LSAFCDYSYIEHTGYHYYPLTFFIPEVSNFQPTEFEIDTYFYGIKEFEWPTGTNNTDCNDELTYTIEIENENSNWIKYFDLSDWGYDEEEGRWNNTEAYYYEPIYLRVEDDREDAPYKLYLNVNFNQNHFYELQSLVGSTNTTLNTTVQISIRGSNGQAIQQEQINLVIRGVETGMDCADATANILSGASD
jgi:hypothetical protein